MVATPATPKRRTARQLQAEVSAEKEPPAQTKRLAGNEESTEKEPPLAPTKKLSGSGGDEESRALPKGCSLEWFQNNMDSIAEADCILAAQLANKKHICQHTSPEMHKCCDDVFNNVLQIGPHGSENNSVLLLGEAGSGKTHIVEWCIKELQLHRPTTLVLRARGSAYATDVECLRHLGTQMTDRLESVPHANASFKEGIDWIKGVFRTSFQRASAMVMVLDQFEYFCSRARQTLLYNLFDIAQEAGMHLSVIGTSEKMDVMDLLEKRIKSRFSMRHLHTLNPTTMDGLVHVLTARLKLPTKSGLKASFVTQFAKYVEAALFAKRCEWKPHLELGQPPSWFLAQCIPVARFLHEACPQKASTSCSSEPLAKRPCVANSYLASATNREATMLLLDSLTEDDHIVLLALYRLNARKLPRTLSTVLHEIQLLHETPGQSILHAFNVDLYAAAFDRLVRLKLVELAKTSADTAKRHVLCVSSVDRIYGEFVRELGASKTGLNGKPNPLRDLPLPVTQWASIQRA